MIPKQIAKEHVLNAITEIDNKGIPENRKSTRFSLKYNGKQYPPKYIICIANKYANGEELHPSMFSGGKETNNFLKKLGFEIIEANKESIQ